MSDYTRVYFEGLGIDFDVPSVAFSIGSYSIHWYGIIIAFGFALAVRRFDVGHYFGYHLRKSVLCNI